MTDQELNVIARALAPVVRDLIAKSLAVVDVKLSVLEQREALHGRDGRDGNSIHTGYGAPAFEGKASDVYVDVKSGDIYQCR